MKTKVKETTLLGYALPLNWIKMGPFGPDGYAYRTLIAPPHGAILRVIETRGDHGGHEWLHVSMSHDKSLPTYEEMKEVKHIFVGDERTAVQIFPKRSQHVNIHDFCLHLWVCLDADLLPDFGEYGTI